MTAALLVNEPGYPASSTAAEKALHLIVPVIVDPFAVVASIVNVPPGLAGVNVTFPEPWMVPPPFVLTVLTRYDLPLIVQWSVNMSPEPAAGRQNVKETDRGPSLCWTLHCCAFVS